MIEIEKHIISHKRKITDALFQLNELGEELTLFVLNDDGVLVGTVTDGDIRRGLLLNLALQDTVEQVMYKNYRFIREGDVDHSRLQSIRELGVTLLPIVDEVGKIKKIVNLQVLQTILPIDAVIMAGGEGMRLRPLTEKIPKPLLIVGHKPIIEHNIDRLINFGVEQFWICLGYRGDQIKEYFGKGTEKGIRIQYKVEADPLGTIGAVKAINEFKNDHVLVINSDLLTNIDYLEFYNEFVKQEADFAVATIPYNVNVPYAVLETSNGHVISFKEKPTYTYHSSAGIYLAKKGIFESMPNGFFNATDLMELLIKNGKRVISYPLIGYWLDIGRHEDYAKANEDIKHLKF